MTGDVQVDTHRNNTALDAAQAEIKRLETALGGARIVNMGLFVMCIIFIPVMSGVSYMAGMDRATSARSQNTRAAHAQPVDWSNYPHSLTCTEYVDRRLVSHMGWWYHTSYQGPRREQQRQTRERWQGRDCIEYSWPTENGTRTNCEVVCGPPSAP